MYNYYIGIDVTKDIHYATILDSKQTVLVPPFPFHNTSASFEKLLTAEIIGEIGDVKRFPSPSHIISYVGLNSTSKQGGYSDTSDKQRITKKGNRHLRAALFLAAEKSALYESELNAYYNKKKLEGIHHRVINRYCP